MSIKVKTYSLGKRAGNKNPNLAATGGQTPTFILKKLLRYV